MIFIDAIGAQFDLWWYLHWMLCFIDTLLADWANEIIYNTILEMINFINFFRCLLSSGQEHRVVSMAHIHSTKPWNFSKMVDGGSFLWGNFSSWSFLRPTHFASESCKHYGRTDPMMAWCCQVLAFIFFPKARPMDENNITAR